MTRLQYMTKTKAAYATLLLLPCLFANVHVPVDGTTAHGPLPPKGR